MTDEVSAPKVYEKLLKVMKEMMESGEITGGAMMVVEAGKNLVAICYPFVNVPPERLASTTHDLLIKSYGNHYVQDYIKELDKNSKERIIEAVRKPANVMSGTIH